MKRIALKGMSFDELIDLRDSAEHLIRQRATAERRLLEERLARLSGFAGRRGPRRGGSLKGRKIAPKYKNPENSSETWAGRGARPRWLQGLLKQGRKLEEFAIGKVAASRAKPAGRKRGRPKTAKSS